MTTDKFEHFARRLFEEGLVDTISWSFDISWRGLGNPWVAEKVNEFSSRNALVGHGVSFSCQSEGESEYQSRWINRLKQEVQQLKYQHISEHLGWCRAGEDCANIGLPYAFNFRCISSHSEEFDAHLRGL